MAREERLLQAATLHLSCVTARLASLGSCGDNHSGVHEPHQQVRFTGGPGHADARHAAIQKWRHSLCV
jgi:hypothetical protein